jgi:hypothetical protein
VNLKVFVSVIVSGLSQEVEPHAIKLVWCLAQNTPSAIRKIILY